MLNTYRAEKVLHFLTVLNVGGHELRRVHLLSDDLLPLHRFCWLRLYQRWCGTFGLPIVRCPCRRSFIDFCNCLKMKCGYEVSPNTMTLVYTVLMSVTLIFLFQLPSQPKHGDAYYICASIWRHATPISLDIDCDLICKQYFQRASQIP